ncbi:MAG: response regulator [Fidelibacterota bacterium]
MDKSGKTTLLIVDDHRLFREGLKSLLQNSHIHIAGEAKDAKSALEAIRNLQPDLVLMDISLPGISGIECCRQITNQFPSAKVIILTMHKSEEFLAESFKAGASGFLLKNAAAQELFTAIESIHGGKKYISADMTSTVINRLTSSEDRGITDQPALTNKETEIVRLIAQGMENQDIAHALHISVSTTKTHRANIMRKLSIHKSIDLVKYALRNGLIDLDQ